MSQFFEKLGYAITSMAALIFALVLTITAMVFFSHTLFYEIFPPEMAEWEKSVATWTLACAWELTVLLTTCIVTHLNKKIPLTLAICSGFILILFLHGFEPELSLLQYVERWFIGILVAAINIVFSQLFFSKWESTNTVLQLTKAKTDFDQLFTYTEELEAFKAREMEKLTCIHCGKLHDKQSTS